MSVEKRKGGYVEFDNEQAATDLMTGLIMGQTKVNASFIGRKITAMEANNDMSNQRLLALVIELDDGSRIRIRRDGYSDGIFVEIDR